MLFWSADYSIEWRSDCARPPTRVAQTPNPEPIARLAAVADTGSLEALAPAGPSPHLARWGIAPADDDGVVCARLAIAGARVLAAAQDARFLGGSIGTNHGAALHRLFLRAVDERPDVLLLLVDSGGVRLHEANAAELALARALRVLYDVRRAGIATLAIVTGSAFGGASVLASACEHLRFLPEARFGLSGPGVVEMAHGKAELDAADPAAVTALFGASARVAAGIGARVDPDRDSLRGAIRAAAQDAQPFGRTTLETWDAKLAARLAGAGSVPAPAEQSPTTLPMWPDATQVDSTGWLWRLRDSDVHLLRPLAPLAFSPAVAVAIAAALDDGLAPGAPLVVVEDSPGHAATRAAEALGVSEYLAAHAARIALVQQEGSVVLGLLAGCGHSAAFFVNALQAATLDALAGARIEAMAPQAIARVTRLPATALAALIEGDALMGQPVRHLEALGGAARTHADLTSAALLARVAELR
jgi:malonate decarboxylase beta subunit